MQDGSLLPRLHFWTNRDGNSHRPFSRSLDLTSANLIEVLSLRPPVPIANRFSTTMKKHIACISVSDATVNGLR